MILEGKPFRMITSGSVSREEAAARFDFLAEGVRGRRASLKEFTHTDPDFVFWIYPDGRLFDAKDAHIRNYPKGHAHILKDKPEYGGFLRGRVATRHGHQLIVVYCREDALFRDTGRMIQFLKGITHLPVPLEPAALVVSDNADIYGTLDDIEDRIAAISDESKSPLTSP
ncbi:hypothetical protein OKA04_19040 [Luteolibacter flavescens]|uniref:Uncharacterized protein n=1 Tax=Luteolibacter flavescens TaxID=1859460 RepID=A0ABT3FU71_9BACT|nr:hypothetical protein [Luteolibacter flavescens]MCW1886844.1 hypothetical protein [Luteolibacter flavescens]